MDPSDSERRTTEGPRSVPTRAALEDFRQQLLSSQPAEMKSVNPMLDPALDANVLNYLPEGHTEPGTNKHGQPIVKPEGISFTRLDVALGVGGLE